MPGETVVVVFPSRSVLVKALDYLNGLDYLKIEDAAIVAKANSGEVVVLDGDLSANEGGIAGGTLGAALAALGLVHFGALALPGIGPIIALGTGILIGGIVGRTTGRFATYLRDVGFKNYQVDALAARLQAGHPALVLELASGSPDVLPRLREELKAFKAELVERLRESWPGAALGETGDKTNVKRRGPVD
ncbi:MAG: hypothetical protein HXY40_00810 [Chloroflexi bacterium]|nr:hypothetical protein [Chloroflexota bacterium]